MTTVCEFYNETICADSPGENGCNQREECPDRHDPEKRTHCFVLWHYNNATRKMTVKMKGCFLNNVDCFDKEQCVEKSETPKKDLMFCCCEGDMCNQNFTWDPTPTQAAPVNSNQAVLVTENNGYFITICLVVFVCVTVVLIVVGGLLVKRRKMRFNELPTMEPHPLPPPSPYIGMRPIQLLEIKARGRFGAVWKAQYKTEEVAVKIFPIQVSNCD